MRVNRTTASLAGAVAGLAVIAGIASATAPSDIRPDAHAAATRMPVQRTTVTCPAPSSSEVADTTYTAFSPGGGTGSGGKAALLPAPDDQPGTASSPSATSGGKDKKGKGDKAATTKPVAPLTAAGKPAGADNATDDAPALIGTADGALAPGYTVQQTTRITAGDGRGLMGTSCAVPSAESWFPAASTASSREDYVHLINPDDTPAEVDVEMFDKGGQLDTPSGNDLTVPGHASVPVRLSTLTTKTEDDLTVHVVARSGRVGAELQAVDTESGGDWMPATAAPADRVVLPALPKDTTAAHLVVFAPGSDDADLKVRLTTPTGAISPAGHETLHVKNRMSTAVDLGAITQGEPGALLLSAGDPRHPVPVVAALRITRGKDSQEMALVPGTAPVSEQGTVSGNTLGGDTLFLTAPQRAATVRVASSAATGGGQPASTTVRIKAGATVAVSPPKPAGKKARGTFAVTVSPGSGGPVYAGRMLADTSDGVPMFTIQPVPDDHAKVAVPGSREDLSILNR